MTRERRMTFSQMYEWLKKKSAEKNMTMDEYARWFLANVKDDDPSNFEVVKTR
jgi:hypothetical protein